MLKPVLAITALAVLIAAVVLGALAVTEDDDPPTSRPAVAEVAELTVEDEFRLDYPRTWEPAPEQDRGTALAGLRRTAGDGQMLVTRGPRTAKSLDTLAAELTARLDRQLPDFRLVRASTTKLASGDALSYTFVRTTSGQAQNITVVPDDDRTFTLTSVLAGGEDAAATEAAAIVRSFEPL